MNRLLATTIGTAAKRARLSAHLTQAQTAEALGVALEVYGRLERGSSLPRVSTFMRLCEVLHASPNVLLGIEREKKGRTAAGPRVELGRLIHSLEHLNDRSLRLLRFLFQDLQSRQ